MKYLWVAAALGLLMSFSHSRLLVLATKPEMCNQPHSMAGMPQDGAACMAFMPAWSYDATKNACVDFIFGGCGGNSNQFTSKDECEKACKD